MTANDVMALVRMRVDDMDKSEVSDFQILRAINDALRMMCEACAKANGPLFINKSLLNLTNGSVVLPAGFVKEIKAFDSDGVELFNVHHDDASEGEFSISGTLLKSEESSVALWYFAYPAEVASGADTIGLPDSMKLPIAQIAASAIKGDGEEVFILSNYFTGSQIPEFRRRSDKQ